MIENLGLFIIICFITTIIITIVCLIANLKPIKTLLNKASNKIDCICETIEKML